MDGMAQGFVEVTSYVASFEAADAMAKAADVVLKRVHKVDGPIVCVVCEGDVAACQAAVDAAAAICKAKGTLRGTNIIARPDAGNALYEMLDDINNKKAAKKQARMQAQQEALNKVACNSSAAGAEAKPVSKAKKKK